MEKNSCNVCNFGNDFDALFCENCGAQLNAIFLDKTNDYKVNVKFNFFYFIFMNLLFGSLIFLSGSILLNQSNEELILFFWLMLGIYLFVVILFSSYKFFEINRRTYIIKDNYFEISTGIFGRRTKTLNLNEISYISFHQNIFERIFDLGRIEIKTNSNLLGRVELSSINNATKEFVIIKRLMRI